MSNELRDPHDPVIPGEYVHPPEGHGGVTMPIGQSAGDIDPHEPVMPEGMKLTEVAHVEDTPVQESPHGSESYGEMQRRVEGEQFKTMQEFIAKREKDFDELSDALEAANAKIAELSKPQMPVPPPSLPLDEQLASEEIPPSKELPE